MCTQCQELMINGVRCHETGCPEAWRDEDRECKWCGSPFRPQFKHQEFDDVDCGESYYS